MTRFLMMAAFTSGLQNFRKYIHCLSHAAMSWPCHPLGTEVLSDIPISLKRNTEVFPHHFL